MSLERSYILMWAATKIAAFAAQEACVLEAANVRCAVIFILFASPSVAASRPDLSAGSRDPPDAALASAFAARGTVPHGRFGSDVIDLEYAPQREGRQHVPSHRVGGRRRRGRPSSGHALFSGWRSDTGR
jgi:hypothetical protein